MTKLVWDESKDRQFEMGTKKAVLFPKNGTSGAYAAGVAWNGLTGVTESPSGGEETALYADDIKYASMYSPEDFGCTIEAYTYPKEFEPCDGSVELAPGVSVGQQDRVPFGLCYRTILGNADTGSNYGYKLHIIYGATASPSEKEYATVNDSPDAITFSWECTTSLTNVDDDLKPTACLIINSTKVDATKLAALETILYGAAEVEPRLPLPAEVKTLLTAA